MKYFSYIVAMSLLSVLLALGQDFEVGGQVSAKGTKETLGGANVRLKGTNLGTATDANGKFHLTIKDMESATLVVSFIGYRNAEVRVTRGRTDLLVLQIELEQDVLKTSEVVVVGLASTVKRENLANSVATVSAKELTIAPTQTIDAALSGKFAGVYVSENSGAPGGGISVNLRGVTTINAENQPLYIVDGVIIDNTATQAGVDAVTLATGGGNQNFQDNPVNRVADLNPNDIETIEVLKGPSAAAIYGSKASNGVVVINTRHGAPGRTYVDVSQQIGYTSLLKKLGSRKFTAATAQAAFGPTGLSEFNKGKTVDYEDEMYGQKGLLSETSVSVRGGTDNTRFYVSGLLKNDEGIIKNTGYKKYGAKVNLDHQLAERVDVSLYTNFIRSSSDRGLTNNDNSGTTYGVALAFTPSFLDLRPSNGKYPDNPFISSNPLHTRDVMKNNELVNRTINSARLKINLYRTQEQLLDFITMGGMDFYSQTNHSYFPIDLQFERTSSQPGTTILGETTSKNNNLYLNLIHNYIASSDLTFRTSVGTQIENRDLSRTLTVTKDLIAGQQENVDQGASINVSQDVILRRDQGLYAQEEVDLGGRIYLTAGVRADASSANGDTKKYFLFPKASASARLSQYDFWSGISNVLPEFKVRAAYGVTGNSPIPGAKYNSFIPANIDGKGGLLIGTRRGNGKIEPEKASELEAGFDATVLDEKATVEFSYYTRGVKDLLLFRQLPPSTGFNEEIINSGEMETNGVEIGVGLAVYRSDMFSWTSRINFYKTSSTITKLTVPPFNTLGFADVLGRFRVEEGKSATQIVGRENGVLKPLGDETPDFQMSFSNSFTYERFDLSFLWDWKQGGDVINLTKLLTDLGGTTEDLDTKDGQNRVNAFGTTTHQLIEDGTYLKLREISLGYSLDDATVAKLFGSNISYVRVGVAGRNILTFTTYSSYDPEVSNFGNRAIGRSIEVTPFPSARSFYFNLSLGY